MKSGNLNFLEPSGLLQACNGTDLPFYISSNLLSVVRCLEAVSCLVGILSDLQQTEYIKL